MQAILIKELKERFPDYRISPLETTCHINVLRLSKAGSPTLVAKTIWHDCSDLGGDMGLKAQDKKYRTEVKILKMLPAWWGIQLIDNFKTELNRVIVTNELKNTPWSSYKKGGNDAETAKLLQKQIHWLHSHKIAHIDFELKNILLTDSATPIIIDFEKATLTATKEQMKRDYTMLLNNLKEHPNTKSIGTILERISNQGTRTTRRNKTRRVRKM